jgi:hypothetical protein
MVLPVDDEFVERAARALRYDGASWEFALDERADGRWAVLSVPLNDGVVGAEALHAAAILAVTLDSTGALTDDTMVHPINPKGMGL